MVRVWLSALVGAVAVALCAPLSAHARTACPDEDAPATASNAAAVSDAIFCLFSQVRAHYDLPAFTRDARLDSAARLHSTDMAQRGFFAHTSPDGLKPGDRATAQGYTAPVGENIAYGNPNARAVVLSWMASAGHCGNLLGGARDIGIGTATSSQAYYTQMFGEYISRPVDDAASNHCPYKLNLADLDDAAPAVPAPPAPTPTPVSAHATAARPALSRLALSPRRLRAGRRATISYRLSAPATVTLRVQRAGRRGRYTTLSAKLTQAGAAGANSMRFNGRDAGQALSPGRYRLQGVATDVLGKTSRLARSSFVVVRR